MKKIFYIILITPVLLLILGFSFYWFEWRPVQIKHECSWVKMHTDAIPAKVGLTDSELEAKGLIKTCLPAPIQEHGLPPLSNNYSPGCEFNNQDVEDKYKPQKYVPARDWYVPATKAQYNFCLHDKGL